MKLKIIVFLTPEARTLIAGEPLHEFVEHGLCFPCVSYEQNGSFLEMKVIHTQNGQPVIVEISLPLHYVFYTVSGEAIKTLGFQ